MGELEDQADHLVRMEPEKQDEIEAKRLKVEDRYHAVLLLRSAATYQLGFFGLF